MENQILNYKQHTSEKIVYSIVNSDFKLNFIAQILLTAAINNRW